MSRNPNRTRCQVLNRRVWAKRDHTRRRSHHDGEPGPATESLQRRTGDASLSSPSSWPIRVRASSRCSSGPNLKRFVGAFPKSLQVGKCPPMQRESYRRLGTARCFATARAAVQGITRAERSGEGLVGEALGEKVVMGTTDW